MFGSSSIATPCHAVNKLEGGGVRGRGGNNNLVFDFVVYTLYSDEFPCPSVKTYMMYYVYMQICSVCYRDLFMAFTRTTRYVIGRSIYGVFLQQLEGTLIFCILIMV